jgi:hypothetical protein
MNSLSLTDKSKDVHLSAESRQIDPLDEPWFDDPPPSSRPRSSAPPPVVHVGEFLGDPEVDAWLR